MSECFNIFQNSLNFGYKIGRKSTFWATVEVYKTYFHIWKICGYIMAKRFQMIANMKYMKNKVVQKPTCLKSIIWHLYLPHLASPLETLDLTESYSFISNWLPRSSEFLADLIFLALCLYHTNIRPNFAKPPNCLLATTKILETTPGGQFRPQKPTLKKHVQRKMAYGLKCLSL